MLQALPEDDIRVRLVEHELKVTESVVQLGKEPPNDRVVMHELGPRVDDLVEALLQIGALRDGKDLCRHRAGIVTGGGSRRVRFLRSGGGEDGCDPARLLGVRVHDREMARPLSLVRELGEPCRGADRGSAESREGLDGAPVAPARGCRGN